MNTLTLEQLEQLEARQETDYQAVWLLEGEHLVNLLPSLVASARRTLKAEEENRELKKDRANLLAVVEREIDTLNDSQAETTAKCTCPADKRPGFASGDPYCPVHGVNK